MIIKNIYYDYYNKKWVFKNVFGTITKSTGNNGSGTFYVVVKNGEADNKNRCGI